MYRTKDKSQSSFLDFNQPLGLHMNPDNCWVRLAKLVPWDQYEEKYAGLFPSGTGNVAKPFRMALGALIIQKKYGFSDRELVEEITENPYLQYFIGLPGYQETEPLNASLLVSFRKRIDLDVSMFLNEALLQSQAASKDKSNYDHHNKPTGSSSSGNQKGCSSDTASDEGSPHTDAAEMPVSGTLILDATCTVHRQTSGFHRIFHC